MADPNIEQAATISGELRKALIDFIQGTTEAVKQGADFAKEQVPLVLQEIVGAQILEAGIWVVALLIVIVGAWWITGRMLKWAAAMPPEADMDFIIGLAWVARIVATAIAGYNLTVSLHSLFYAIFFPRLVILNYLKGLL